MEKEPATLAIDFTGPFTVAEIIEIEELAGKGITDLFDGPRGRSLRAVAYVVGKRSDPDFTLDAAAQMWVKLDG